jgi:hypothetical protein
MAGKKDVAAVGMPTENHGRNIDGDSSDTNMMSDPNGGAKSSPKGQGKGL